jgi:hypothetical protein
MTWASEKDGFAITWEHTFSNLKEGDVAYFAWTYPYSF